MAMLLSEPDHVDEPQELQDYLGLVSRVAATHQPVVVRRGGADVAALISVEHLDLFQEWLAHRQAEQLAARIDWSGAVEASPPPQHWFEGDEPEPF